MVESPEVFPEEELVSTYEKEKRRGKKNGSKWKIKALNTLDCLNIRKEYRKGNKGKGIKKKN